MSNERHNVPHILLAYPGLESKKLNRGRKKGNFGQAYEWPFQSRLKITAQFKSSISTTGDCLLVVTIMSI